MIKLIKDGLPFDCESAESIKINNLYASYQGIALFWLQEESGTLISMLDGAVFIDFRGGDITELRDFLRVIGAKSIFSRLDFFECLDILPQRVVSVMKYGGQAVNTTSGDLVKSDEVYDILNVDGLDLPPKDIFSVDYCHRKNHGLLDSFVIKGKAAAISLNFENACVITGVASHQKGFGSTVLKGIIGKNSARSIFACADKNLEKFYVKNGFFKVYEAAYLMGEI